MTSPRRCLLLVGSPRGRKSTSYSVGHYLMEGLRASGAEASELLLYEEARSDPSLSRVVEHMVAADLVVLSFPLYVDSLPSKVIHLLEVATESVARESLRGRSLMVMVNSGFPEAHQMACAISSCRLFARDTGMRWEGALSLPAGPMVDGTPLSQAGGRVRRQVRALEAVAKALASGESVPQAAADDYARMAIPRWLYYSFANRMWAKRNRRRGIKADLRKAPYR